MTKGGAGKRAAVCALAALVLSMAAAGEPGAAGSPQPGDSTAAAAAAGSSGRRMWGAALVLGTVAGGIGVSGLCRLSDNVSLVAGVGAWSYGFTFGPPPWADAGVVTSGTRKELTLSVCGRYYATRVLYLLSGVAARRITGSVFDAGGGRKGGADVGAVGVPLAIGMELGGEGAGISGSVEVGFAQYIGPGADELQFVAVGPDGWTSSVRMEGSSGLLIGVGINYYF